MSEITRIARIRLAAAIAANDEYEAEVEKWYVSGDGRPTSEGGRGYTFPSCRHGTSRWTDYDNICGGCEDEGSYFDWYVAARAALWQAKSDLRERDRRTKMLLDSGIMQEVARYNGGELWNDLLSWAIAPVR